MFNFQIFKNRDINQNPSFRFQLQWCCQTNRTEPRGPPSEALPRRLLPSHPDRLSCSLQVQSVYGVVSIAHSALRFSQTFSTWIPFHILFHLSTYLSHFSGQARSLERTERPTQTPHCRLVRVSETDRHRLHLEPRLHRRAPVSLIYLKTAQESPPTLSSDPPLSQVHFTLTLLSLSNHTNV